jgi:predicted molibdopterin-dependent oxidoreductase YjgC
MWSRFLTLFRQPGDEPAAPVSARPGGLSFWFDGKPVTAREGQSVAAALVAAGVRSLRIDEAGNHKGLLCGIGFCFECRCRIDGEPDRRACMTPVASGMRVERQQGLV